MSFEGTLYACVVVVVVFFLNLCRWSLLLCQCWYFAIVHWILGFYYLLHCYYYGLISLCRAATEWKNRNNNRLSDVNTNSQIEAQTIYLHISAKKKFLPDFKYRERDCERWKRDERKLNFITCQRQKYAYNLTVPESDSLFSLFLLSFICIFDFTKRRLTFSNVNRLMVLAFCHFQHILRLTLFFPNIVYADAHSNFKILSYFRSPFLINFNPLIIQQLNCNNVCVSVFWTELRGRTIILMPCVL